MMDVFYAILKGLSSSAGAQVFDHFADDSDNPPAETGVPDIDFSNQIGEVVETVAADADSKEDIPSILDGLQLEVTVDGKRRIKRFTDVSVDEDDSFPWNTVGSRADCPLCGQVVDASAKAFEQHWTDSSKCPGIDETEIEAVLDEQMSVQEATKGY
ncbi:hypothetical protein [Haloarcula sp. JP-L23]|uniref:hypothetical protein n=1 Tax=Haloarcula sp. JP-L23 TaxID=2716717 RepID=UPI00140EA1AA|nr:hypothetical protein G9465_22610 [Haloarcula sp. JP-L23]